MSAPGETPCGCFCRPVESGTIIDLNPLRGNHFPGTGAIPTTRLHLSLIPRLSGPAALQP